MDSRPDQPAPDAVSDLPRLVAWLRSAYPSAAGHEVAALLGAVDPERLRRLEGVLDDLAGGCRPPDPAALAALTELDDLLARGPGGPVIDPGVT
jgi:hypothetical protein